MEAPVNAAFLAEIEAEARPRQAEAEREGSTPLPVEFLPAGMEAMVKDLEAGLGLAPDYTLGPALVAASVAIGTSARLEPFPGNYTHAALWVVVVAPPGTGKTPGAKTVFGPLRSVDKEQYGTYKEALKDYRKALRQHKADEGTPEPKAPTCTQHLIGDATLPALVGVLSHNPRGVAMVRDEIAGLVGDMGRESSGGDEAKYLSLWSGDNVTVNRKTDNEIVQLYDPFLSLYGGIQPGVLHKMASEGRDQNGFMDRFVFLYPERVAMPELPASPLAPSTLAGWSRTLSRLLSIELPTEGEPTFTLVYTPEAQRCFNKYHQQTAREFTRLHEQGERLKAGYRSKLMAYVNRLALLFALVEWAEGDALQVPTTVNTEAILRAIAFVEYFSSTADKVLFTLYESTPVDRMPTTARGLLDKLNGEFTTADAEAYGLIEGLSKRTVKRTLNRWVKAGVIRKVRHGNYSKVYE